MFFMERVVYIGPYNSSRSKEFFNKSLEYLKENKGNRFYYILPNGKLLVKYRKKFIEEVKQTFEINLFTFDNIVDKLLKDRFYTSIDDEMKEALVARAIIELNHKGNLSYYEVVSTKRGFASAVSSIIGQIKRSLISPEDYLKNCPDHPFYREIGLIYQEYERNLHVLELLDREGSYIRSLEVLKDKKDFFDELDFVLIDYFFDFRPQELQILKEMAKSNCSIYINMPFNRDENFNTFTNTVDLLKDLGFSIVYEEGGSNNYFEELASILFTEDKKKLNYNSNIHVLKASSTYLEVKKVCEEIKRHYAKGIQLKDMAIVLASPDRYLDRIFQVFEEETIPIALDKETSLLEIPVIKEILHILEVKRDNRNINNIINRVKSNFFPLCKDDMREIIEYTLRKGNFNSSIKDEIDRILAVIEEERNSIPDMAKPEEMVKSIMELVKKYDVVGRILNIYDSIGDYNLLNRDFTAISKLKEIFDKIIKFASKIYDQMTMEEFINLLERYINRETVVEIEGNSDGISLLTPVTARGQNYKILFVMGLSQGDYPKINSHNFFFKENNMNTLKNIGIDVKNYYEILDKESLIFSTVIASCTETLYLSYSQESTEDEETIPSMFLDELISRIKGNIDVQEADKDYLFKDGLSMLTTKEELSRYILNKYKEGNCEEELFHMYNHIDNLKFKEVNESIYCEFERNNDGFNEYNGLIEDDEVIKDLEEIHKDKVYSISYLESYGKCPYYFLLNNILNVEEMERQFQDFSPLDRGSINHQVLEEYYTAYKKQIEDHVLGKSEFNPDETYDFIISRVTEKMKSITADIDSPLWKLRIENNSSIILDFIKSDLNRLSKLKEKVLPYDFEVPFGRYENFELEIGDLKIPFTGVIDRIDKYVHEDKYILIDYKNTASGVRDISSMISGVSLQLPLYILSQMDKKVVAAMYGVLSTGEFKLALGNTEETNLITKNNKGALTKEQLDELINITKEHIKYYMDSILSADFSVNPKECSNYCIYKDICRYKNTLEV